MWISPVWKQTVIWICEASPVNLDSSTPKAPRRDGGGEEKCTEDDVRFIGPARRCELAKHERKIQGMKLATAPLLCDLSPWTSVTPRCALFFFFPPLPSFCITFHCNQPSRKMLIMPFNVCRCGRVKDTYDAIWIICKYFGEKSTFSYFQLGLKHRSGTDVHRNEMSNGHYFPPRGPLGIC